MNKIEGFSDIKKEKIYKIEKQNIENINKIVKQNSEVRENIKDGCLAKEYEILNYIVYELSKKEDMENPTLIVSPKRLKGLSWGDLIDIQENNNEWQTNIEQGIWITYYKNKIRYTISKNKKVIIGLQLEKEENGITISYFAESEKIEKQIQESAKNRILLIDIIKNIKYENDEIEKTIMELITKCITIDQGEIEKQLLIEEKEELQENVNTLKEQITNITKEINEIAKQADVAEKETKRTIEEISRVTKENETLKNSIINVRKSIAKKCAYIPIIGRIIIKELNKEFGESALPSGR